MTNLPHNHLLDYFDVIVVGGGGAGLAAALTAANLGAEVLVIEKQEQPGGTTRLSVGSVTAAKTHIQLKKGYQDSYELFEEDIKTYAGPKVDKDNEVMRNVLIRETAETVSWLESLGVSFVGPFFEPPHKMPRMHNAFPSGKTYIMTLLHHCRQLGVQIITGARVTDLIKSNGRILGVRIETTNGDKEILARSGVVLATGDYSNGTDLKEKYVGKEAAMISAVNEANTGDGHKLGASVGGVLVNMDLVDPQVRFPPPPVPTFLDMLPYNKSLGRLMTIMANRIPRNIFRLFAKQILTARMAPDVKLFQGGAILVNEKGSRFADELNFTAYDVSRGAGGRAYIILDARLARKFSKDGHAISTAPGIAYANWKDYKRGRPDLIKSGDNLSELAEVLGMSSSTLEETVADYNNKTAKGSRLRIEEGPFYSMGPLLAQFMVTDGSLLVDESCRVVNKEGEPIPGLYAAGAVGQGGMVLPGHGLHLQWAFTSGRLAGRAVVFD